MTANTNNRIIIKVKKTTSWTNSDEDDIRVGDNIRWVGQYSVTHLDTWMRQCVVEEMTVDKITPKTIIGYFGGQYKKVARGKGKGFQKMNVKEYNKPGRTDKQRFQSGLKNLPLCYDSTGAVHTRDDAQYVGHNFVWFRHQ